MEQLDVTRAQALLDDGALLLDVREDNEWAAGHAPAAAHVPMGQITASVGDLPTDRPVVVICRSGARSNRVAAWLVQQGLDAHNLQGGMQAWATAGQPVVDPAGQPGTVA